MATEPILDLSTLTDNRPPIRVDGTVYHLKSPEELTLAESQNFTKWGHELEALGKQPEKVGALDALVTIVARSTTVDMPVGVFEKLSSVQRMAIVEVFTGLLLGKRLQLAGALARMASQSIGANSSPGSNMPSGATPDGGSTAPQPLS
ncbi:hypothetical protein [Devosia sp.]|uniref:hypothetical protein n=1 Tax=Devosia sp. TaxID=1871048 RepID=UPI001AC4CA6E|nr:hypothetical protein [Devosia sp.]MBN9333859.1 hypothetical protein [Devosia sp.]